MSDDDELDRSDLLALVDTARELATEIDFADLVLAILTRASALTGSESGSVMLYDADRDGLYFAAATGPRAASVMAKFGESGPERVPIGSSKAGQVYTNGEPLIDGAIERDAEHYKEVDRQVRYRTESMVCVPLAIAASRIGVVQLLNKASGDYTRRDVRLLSHFADHAAVAIRNARHIRDLLAHKGLFTSAERGRKAGDLLRELAAPAQRERMSVMFADMRGFARLCVALGEPTAIAAHLNEFLTMLATEVVKHDGLVNKFLGDGVMALFRGAGTEARALRCAFAIVAEFAALRERWQSRRNEVINFLDVGCGIATGEAIIGSIGAGPVKDFTALGTAVNLAAAFQDDARDGRRVLIDQETYFATRDIIADADDAPAHELRHAQGTIGVAYRRYHVRRLRPAPGEAIVTAQGRAAQSDARGLDAYYRNSWAIVIGVDGYRSPAIARLNYAVADARAVADALPAAGFAPERTELLLNEQATRDAILRAILGKLGDMHRDDRLLVFFALHGEVRKHRKGEEGYLLPFDADPANLPLTALPMADCVRHGKSLPAKHVLFVLDSCFSGYAAMRGSASTEGADLTALTQEPVIQLMTAGTGTQKAIEDGGHGIFTRSFLKGLQGFADPEGSGLTVMKLADYVLRRVLAESANRQTPQLAKLDGEGEFLLLPPRATG